MIPLFTQAEKENLIKKLKRSLISYIIITVFCLAISVLATVFWRNLGKTFAQTLATLTFGALGCFTLVFWNMRAYYKKVLFLYEEKELLKTECVFLSKDEFLTTHEGVQYFIVKTDLEGEEKNFYLFSERELNITPNSPCAFYTFDNVIYSYERLPSPETEGEKC